MKIGTVAIISTYSLILVALSQSATIKQSFNDSAVVSSRQARSSTTTGGSRRDTRYSIESPGRTDEPQNPPNPQHPQQHQYDPDDPHNNEKRCVKCVYYNQPPGNRDQRERFGGSGGIGYDDYYGSGRGGAGGGGGGSNRDHYNRRPDYDRDDGGYDWDRDRGGYRGGYDDPPYPPRKGYDPLTDYDRPTYDYDRIDYDRTNINERPYYPVGGGGGGGGAAAAAGYDYGDYGDRYDYNSRRRPIDRDDYGGRRNYPGREYDRDPGYGRWEDESIKGSSSSRWDGRGREHYFGSGRHDYDSPYAGGWSYGGGENGDGGGRRRWRDEGFPGRSRSNYPRDRDESSTTLVSSHTLNDNNTTAVDKGNNNKNQS